jgi:hypothetical protein
MTEHSIIFNGDMVRAILRGEKTQTRRPVKPQPATGCIYSINGAHNAALHLTDAGCQVRYIPPTGRSKDHLLLCPFGQPGDRLWVRETFALGEPPYFGVAYRADEGDNPEDVGGERQKWTPSIHMPRYLSRITLEITDINVERVQDITADEAIKEGVVDPIMGTYGLSPKTVFRDMWNDIYAERGLGWNENPWVWAITFRRVETSHGG